MGTHVSSEVGAHGRGKYPHIAMMAQTLLATTVINCKEDQCSGFSVSDTAPDGLNGKKFFALLCVVS